MNLKKAFLFFAVFLAAIAYGVYQYIILPRQGGYYTITTTTSYDVPDISSLLEYQNLYMGDSSNLINLFYSLPLGELPQDFELNSTEYSFGINYRVSTPAVDMHYLNDALIYDATAAFTLIDNLEIIRFRFRDTTFEVQRKNVESQFEDLTKLLDKNNWQRHVVDEIDNISFDSIFETYDTPTEAAEEEEI